MALHNELGKQGEKVVIELLRKSDYKILRHNWHFERYEIDIIAENEEWIIFVEVKTRASYQWGNPEDAISKSKIKRIVEAANFYLIQNNISKSARFDVAAVIVKGNDFEIEYIEDAFLPPVN